MLHILNERLSAAKEIFQNKYAVVIKGRTPSLYKTGMKLTFQITDYLGAEWVEIREIDEALQFSKETFELNYWIDPELDLKWNITLKV